MRPVLGLRFRKALLASVFAVGVALLFVVCKVPNPTWLDFANALLVPLMVVVVAFGTEHRTHPALRKLPFVAAVLGHAALFMAFLLGAMAISFTATRWVAAGRPSLTVPVQVARELLSDKYLTEYCVAMATMLVFSFFAELSRKLGPGVMRNWLLGNYRAPRLETRVFMFLDLNRSTSIAESIGDLPFSDLLRECFAELTEPVLMTKGEISHYIGDEVIVSWPQNRASRCIECYTEFVERISRRELHFIGKYGFVPEFKAGFHCGEVVATEIGEIKSEVVFHGDVLNTTSRLRDLCGTLGEPVIISKALSDLLGDFGTEPPAKSYGAQALKGKQEGIEVLAPVLYGDCLQRRASEPLQT